MKLLLLAHITSLFSIWLLSCKQAVAKNESHKGVSTKRTSPIPVEGAWKLVYATRNDTITNMSNHFQVKMFANGTFSLFAHHSIGKIKFAGYGKYGFEGNTYHETFLYHTYPPHVGAKDWQDLKIDGDTMYLNGFKKVIIAGKEVSDYPRIREKLIRVNWEGYN